MIVRIVATLLLFLLSQIAHADGVVKMPGGNMIVFKDALCTNEKVLSHVKPEYRAVFKQAAVLWQGKGYAACWTPSAGGQPSVFVVDETGDSGDVPLNVITFDERV